ncbi:MAG: SDR family oxidoreductase [Candidatus Melainabacteria bacterium]|nr:MAG: SDR family oxidoreductase [Candidatus Melainabacteria bacterium]
MSKPAFIIFGAYGNLGSTLAKNLCEKGNDVLLVGRQTQKLALMADSLSTHFYSADCTDFNQVSDCVDIAIDHFGRLDGVVHCISSNLSKPAHLTIEREWFQTINTNLTSAFACLKYSVQAMRDNGGSIVLTSSAAASVPMPNHEASSAAKLGIIGLTRSAASTYARHRIKINAVTPGPVESSSTTSTAAETIVSLLTEQTPWISGHIFGVDASDAKTYDVSQKRQYLF